MRPHRRQPTRLPRPWDSPGKKTGVGCHFLLQCMKWKVKVKSLSRVWLLATPWTAAHQAPPSMGFSRQEDWSGVLGYSYLTNFFLKVACFRDEALLPPAAKAVSRQLRLTQAWHVWTFVGTRTSCHPTPAEVQSSAGMGPMSVFNYHAHSCNEFLLVQKVGKFWALTAHCLV